MTPESHEDRLADLLIRWEELQEQGQDIAAAELCQDCPHLAPELARRIHALKVTAWLDKPLPAAAIQAHPLPFVVPSSSKPLAGRYRLDQLIAEGGFAQVWRGFDLLLQRAVAIKMPKRLGSVEAFIAEARKVARLKHHGIVPIFDVGKEDNTCFLVSEFVEGGSLADRIAKNKPSHQESARIIADVAEALQYAHQEGFVHRDIKPGNILLDHHGRGLLTDFGIAVTTDETSGPSFGTLAYMAPEQVEGKASDSRSDIYSLGVVLHELLTGRLPYQAADPNALRREIVSGPVNLFSTPPSVHSELKRLCQKCLARNPADRYASAGQLAADLRRFLGSAGAGSGTRKFIGGVTAILLMVSAAIGWFLKNNDQPVEQDQPGATIKQNETPPSLEAVLALGKQHFDRKDFKEAIAAYSSAIKKKPDCAEAYHRRGASLFNVGKLQEALVDFDKAVELAPKNAELRRHRALPLMHLRQYDKAIADLEDAVRLNPADQAACKKLLGLNYFYKAAEHEKHQRWKEAIADSTLALKWETAAVHFHQRGCCYFNLKEYEKAVADFTEAIKREPNQARHYEKRGLAYQSFGREEEAKADLEQVRTFQKKTPE